MVAISGIATAYFWPTVLTGAANNIKVDSTVLFIILVCFGITGNGFVPLLIGIIGDMTDLKTAFIVLPVFFAIMIIIFSLEIIFNRRKLLDRMSNFY